MDKYVLKGVCKCLFLKFKNKNFKEDLDNYLRDKVYDLNLFWDILNKNKGVITGSILMEVLYDQKWKNTNIYICVNMNDICNYQKL